MVSSVLSWAVLPKMSWCFSTVFTAFHCRGLFDLILGFWGLPWSSGVDLWISSSSFTRPDAWRKRSNLRLYLGQSSGRLNSEGRHCRSTFLTPCNVSSISEYETELNATTTIRLYEQHGCEHMASRNVLWETTAYVITYITLPREKCRYK